MAEVGSRIQGIHRTRYRSVFQILVPFCYPPNRVFMLRKNNYRQWMRMLMSELNTRQKAE